MSNDIRQGVDIDFEDETRTIYPVSLRQLRSLTKVIEALNFTESDSVNDDAVDKMVDAMVIIFEKIDPELSADRDRIEDIVDVRTVNKAIEAAMGADPNV